MSVFQSVIHDAFHKKFESWEYQGLVTSKDMPEKFWETINVLSCSRCGYTKKSGISIMKASYYGPNHGSTLNEAYAAGMAFKGHY